jgi:superoxide dismutase, Fe-Mn family
MSYEATDFSHLLGLEGFSDALLNNHFSLYQGYVANTNKVLGEIDGLLAEDKAATPEYAELKRRLGWEFNGMRLHELYFGNLSPSALDQSSNLAKKIDEDFGSYDAWLKDFKSTGAMRGIGWAVLYQDSMSGKLINFWINEHDAGHPAGCNPLLIMDVFEHAYMTDYGIKRPDYIASFVKNINWGSVEKRIK